MSVATVSETSTVLEAVAAAVGISVSFTLVDDVHELETKKFGSSEVRVRSCDAKFSPKRVGGAAPDGAKLAT